MCEKKDPHIDSSVFTETRNMKNRIDLPIFLSDNKKSLQMALKQKTTIHYAYYSNQLTHIQWRTIQHYNVMFKPWYLELHLVSYTPHRKNIWALLAIVIAISCKFPIYLDIYKPTHSSIQTRPNPFHKSAHHSKLTIYSRKPSLETT